MSYESKQWKYGDVISADDLNRLEDGVKEALQSGAKKKLGEVITQLVCTKKVV